MSDTALQVALAALSVTAVTFLTTLLGRFTYAIKNGGSIQDAIRGVFCGTNTPPATVNESVKLSVTAKPAPHLRQPVSRKHPGPFSAIKHKPRKKHP